MSTDTSTLIFSPGAKPHFGIVAIKKDLKFKRTFERLKKSKKPLIVTKPNEDREKNQADESICCKSKNLIIIAK